MKKSLILTLFALALPFAQVTRTLTGYPHKTMVYNSGSTATVVSIDTTGSGFSVPLEAVTGRLTVGSFSAAGGNFAVLAGDTVILSGGNGTIYPSGRIVTNDTVSGATILGTIVKGSTVDAGFLNTTHKTIFGDSVVFPFGGEGDNHVICVDNSGLSGECTTVGPESDPVVVASAIYDPGSTDTLVGTSGMYVYVASVVGSEYAASYNAGTTYAVNAIVSYLGSTYISNVGSNVGNTPSSSPTQWTAYVHPADALTYVLNNLISHP